MKLLVFAHTPPPHHGQSYMVQLMLSGFGGDHRQKNRPPTYSDTDYGIECYHVNARLSKKLEDIGDFRVGKFLLLIGYCLQAIWCRYRYGVRTLYYIPAPGKRSALYRDWVVMCLCRPFFRRIILHWHAAGLAKWLETCVQLRTRSLTYRTMREVDLSIVLSRYNQADAEKLFSRHIQVVSNGIADPCPDFDTAILPRRRTRFAARQHLMAGSPIPPEAAAAAGSDPQVVKVLYLAHATAEKGLFDAIQGIRLANEELTASKSALRFRLEVAGTFVTTEDHRRFEALMAQPGMTGQIEYHGFVSGDKKSTLLREADLFCFPTFYQNENQPVNLLEAMAFGLPILTTRWRSIPELFPAGYGGLVDIRSPEKIARGLIALQTAESGERLRETFSRHFSLAKHLDGLAQAMRKLETAPRELSTSRKVAATLPHP